MKTKLMIINKQDPSKTKYIPVGNVGSFMLGKRFSNYQLLIVGDIYIPVSWPDTSDCIKLQKILDSWLPKYLKEVNKGE